jgi:hypothetical protein
VLKRPQLTVTTSYATINCPLRTSCSLQYSPYCTVDSGQSICLFYLTTLHQPHSLEDQNKIKRYIKKVAVVCRNSTWRDWVKLRRQTGTGTSQQCHATVTWRQTLELHCDRGRITASGRARVKSRQAEEGKGDLARHLCSSGCRTGETHRTKKPIEILMLVSLSDAGVLGTGHQQS